jgi:hypothetical protein
MSEIMVQEPTKKRKRKAGRMGTSSMVGMCATTTMLSFIHCQRKNK